MDLMQKLSISLIHVLTESSKSYPSLKISLLFNFNSQSYARYYQNPQVEFSLIFCSSVNVGITFRFDFSSEFDVI